MVSFEELSYPYEVLDDLVENQLVLIFSLSSQLFDEQRQLFLNQFFAECKSIWVFFKWQLFRILGEENIRVTVRQHIICIRYLKNKLTSFNDQASDSAESIFYQTLSDSLNQLENLISTRYPGEATECSVQPFEQTQLLRTQQKIRCQLSVDQLGLILKAADESKVITSKSMSLIFKTIVPYLATTHKEDISWDSMRSSTYHAEANDKAAAIDALESIIKKIRQY